MYTLHGEGMRLVWSGYALEQTSPGQWSFERSRFMPAADWRFSWEVPVLHRSG